MSNRNKNNIYGTCTEHYGTVRNSTECGKIVGKLWEIVPEHVRNIYGTGTEHVFTVALHLFRYFVGYLGNFQSILRSYIFRLFRCCCAMFRYVPWPEQICFGIVLVPGISKLFDIAGTQNIFVARFVPHVPLCSALFRNVPFYCPEQHRNMRNLIPATVSNRSYMQRTTVYKRWSSKYMFGLQ